MGTAHEDNKKYFRQFLHRIETQFYVQKSSPPENRAVYVIMWTKYGTVRLATDDHIIRRMRIACWIPMATDKHPEYPLLLGFPQKQ
jgi:hypothetical protein